MSDPTTPQEAVDASAEEEGRPEPAQAATAAPSGSDDDTARVSEMLSPTSFAPTGQELVIADPTDQVEVVTALDAHDEEQILRRLEAKPMKYLAYDYNQGGVKVVDLSYEGVNEAIREMVSTGKVSIAIVPESLQIETVTEDLGEGPMECWMATVYALDSVTGYGQFGTFVQSKWTKIKKDTAAKRRKDDKTVKEFGGEPHMPNPFARQTALGKAQRNALKLFIPIRVRQAIIARAIGNPQLLEELRYGPGAESLAQLPPPLTDERAEALKAQARALYDEIRRLEDEKAVPLKDRMTPANFHAYLTRAEHSHERLEDNLRYLQTRLAELDPEREETT